MPQALFDSLVQLCVADGDLYGSDCECNGISVISDGMVVAECNRSRMWLSACYFTGYHLY
jgi:hypothetical protein